MNLGFRLVILTNGIKVKRVPVYKCEAGCTYELHPVIKNEMKALLKSLSGSKFQQSIDFTEINEFADVLWGLNESWDEESGLHFDTVLEQKCEEQINLLLDLYGVAKGMQDEEWMEILTKRLSQLSKYVRVMYFTGVN
ncbi:hypothetical protein D3C77_523770 [compost metagenome]